MARENGHGDGDGEGTQKTIFVDTSLDTHLLTIVSDSETVSSLKRKIMLEHRQCFPTIGDISIHCLKVKCRGNFYHMSDSMLVKSAFRASQKDWFLSVDASRLQQCDDIQHYLGPGDQLALPLVKYTRSVDTHDNSQADRPSKPSLVHGSPSKHPKIVPFVNQNVPSVDNFTSDDSSKKVSKNIEKEKSSHDEHCRNVEPDLEQQLDSKVEEKAHTVNKEIKSKKRIRDIHNEDASVKKRRKTQRTEGDIKGLEEDRVLIDDIGKVKDMETRVNDENFIEDKSKFKDAALDVVTKAMDDEHTRTILVSQKTPKRTKKGKSSAHDQVATVVPSSAKNVGEETHPGKTPEASEVSPDVAMVVEKNIQQETPFQPSQTEKGNELVQEADIGNEVPSSSMRVTAEEDILVKHAKDIGKVKDMETRVNDDNSIEDKSKSKNAALDVVVTKSMDDEHTRTILVSQKKPKRTKKGRNSAHDQVAMVVPSSVHPRKTTEASEVIPEVAMVVEKNIQQETPFQSSQKEKGNKLVQEADIGNEVPSSSMSDDLIVKEMKSEEPTERHRSRLHKEKSRKEIKETAGSRTKKIDAGKSASREDEFVKRSSNDAATGTNEEILLPPEIKDKITPVDGLHVGRGRNDDNLDNDAEISKTETIASQLNAEIPEKQDENMGDSKKTEKKIKRKRPSKKSTARKEGENGDLLEIIADVSQEDVATDGDKLKSRDAQISDEGIVKEAKKNYISATRAHSDMPSKPELEPEKSENPEETTKNVGDSKKTEKKIKRKRPSKKSTARKEGENGDLLEKIADVSQEDVATDGDKLKSRDAQISDEGIVKEAKKNYISATRAHSDMPSKPELEPEKSENPEETTKNLTVSQVPKGNDANSDTKLSVREKRLKKKSQQDCRNDDAIHSPPRNENKKELLSSKIIAEVFADGVGVKGRNAPDNAEVKSQKRTTKIDAPKTSKPAQVNKPQPSSKLGSSSESFGRSFKSQKITNQQPTMGQTQVKNLKKSVPGIKSLLNTPATIFGDDSDDSSANDNATINSASSTRTPSGPSSSSGESDSNIGSRSALKNSRSRLKNISMADLLRSSNRFKKARVVASQQVNDTESEPVDFVPESQPVG